MRDDDLTDQKQLALMAIASDELARAELVRVERALKETYAELQWFKDKHPTNPERL